MKINDMAVFYCDHCRPGGRFVTRESTNMFQERESRLILYVFKWEFPYFREFSCKNILSINLYSTYLPNFGRNFEKNTGITRKEYTITPVYSLNQNKPMIESCIFFKYSLKSSSNIKYFFFVLFCLIVFQYYV